MLSRPSRLSATQHKPRQTPNRACKLRPLFRRPQDASRRPPATLVLQQFLNRGASQIHEMIKHDAKKGLALRRRRHGRRAGDPTLRQTLLATEDTENTEKGKRSYRYERRIPDAGMKADTSRQYSPSENSPKVSLRPLFSPLRTLRQRS